MSTNPPGTPRLAVAWNRLAGMAWFRLRSYRRARQRFERILELSGDDFGAYVWLGRVAYRQGDYAGWRRECAHARRTCPERYARLKHPFELFEPRSSAPVDSGSPWQPFRVASVGGQDTEDWPRRAAAGSCGGSFEGSPRRVLDDCSDASERDRFRAMGPIESREVDTLDFEELSRRLAADS